MLNNPQLPEEVKADTLLPEEVRANNELLNQEEEELQTGKTKVGPSVLRDLGEDVKLLPGLKTKKPTILDDYTLSKKDREAIETDPERNTEFYRQLAELGRYNGTEDDFKRETMRKDELLKSMKEEKARWEKKKEDLLSEKKAKVNDFGKSFLSTKEAGDIDRAIGGYNKRIKELYQFDIDHGDLDDHYKEYRRNVENKDPDSLSKLERELNKTYGEYAPMAMKKVQQKDYHRVLDDERKNNPAYKHSPEGAISLAQDFANEGLEIALEETPKLFENEEFRNDFFTKLSSALHKYSYARPYFEALQKKMSDGKSILNKEQLEGLQNVSKEVRDAVDKAYFEVLMEQADRYKPKLSDLSFAHLPREGEEADPNRHSSAEAIEERLERLANNIKSKKGIYAFAKNRESAIKEALNTAARDLAPEERALYYSDTKEGKAYKERFDDLAKSFFYIDQGLMVNEDGLTADGIRRQGDFMKGVLNRISPEYVGDEGNWAAAMTGRAILPMEQEYYAKKKQEGLLKGEIALTQDGSRDIQVAKELIDEILAKTEKGIPKREALALVWNQMFDAGKVNGDYTEAFTTLQLGQKMKNGELSVTEEVLATMLGMKSQIFGSEDTSQAYNVFKGTSEMLPYMALFGLTAKITSGVVGAGLKHVARATTKELFGTMLKRQSVNLGRYIVTSGIQTLMMPQLYAPEYARRRFELGVTPFAENGGIGAYISNERTVAKSLSDAWWNSYSEIFSERLSEVAGPAIKSFGGVLGKGVNKVGGKVLTGKVGKPVKNGLVAMYKGLDNNWATRALRRSHPAVSVQGRNGAIHLHKGFTEDVLGWGGGGLEYLEEFFGGRMSNLFTGDYQNPNMGENNLLGRVLYWDHEDEQTTFFTTTLFGLLFGPLARGLNRVSGHGMELRYTDAKGAESTVRVKQNVAEQILGAYDAETNTFDHSVIDALLKDGHLSEEAYDAVKQNAAATEEHGEQKKKVPERKEKLKKKGYTEEEVDNANLANPIQNEILHQYKDLYDLGLLDTNANGDFLMPSNKVLKGKREVLDGLITKLEQKQGLKPEDGSPSLTEDEIANLERYKLMYKAVDGVIHDFEIKHNARAYRQDEHMIQMGLSTKAKDGSIKQKDNAHLVSKLGEMEDQLEAYEKMTELDIEQENHKLILQEWVSVINNKLAAQREVSENVAKGQTEYISPAQSIEINNATIADLNNKKKNFSKKKQAFVDRYIANLEGQNEELRNMEDALYGQTDQSVSMEVDDLINQGEVEVKGKQEKETNVEQSDKEAKKADIERRREEELTKLQPTSENELLNKIKNIFENNGKPLREDRGKDWIINRLVGESSLTDALPEKDAQEVKLAAYRLREGKYGVLETDTNEINAKYDAELKALESPEIQEKETNKGTKQEVQQEAEVEETIDDFGFEDDTDRGEVITRKKGILYDKIKKRADALSEQAKNLEKAITGRFGKNFIKHIGEKIDKLNTGENTITPAWTEKQASTDPNFNFYVQKHKNIYAKHKGTKRDLTPGQDAAINVLTKLGILKASEVKKEGTLTIGEATVKIHLASNRIQLLKISKGLDETAANELQSQLLLLMSATGNSSKADQDLTFVGNIQSQSPKSLEVTLLRALASMESSTQSKAEITKSKRNATDKARKIALENEYIQSRQDIADLIYLEQEQRAIKADIEKEESIVAAAKDNVEAKPSDKTKVQDKAPKRKHKVTQVVTKEVMAEADAIDAFVDGLAKASEKKDDTKEPMSETFPTISLKALKKAFGFTGDVLRSGLVSYEQKATEVIRLIRETAKNSKNIDGDTFHLYADQLEKLMFELLGGTFEAKTPLERVTQNHFAKSRENAKKESDKKLAKELNNSGSVLASSDQKVNEQRRNFSSLFKAIAEESGMDRERVEIEFFKLAKKGEFKHIKNEAEFIKYLLKLEELGDANDGVFDRLLFGIYQNNITYDEFISYKDFYENASLVRNEGLVINSGNTKNKHDRVHLNPLYSQAELSQIAAKTIMGYALNGKTMEGGLDIRLKTLRTAMNALESKHDVASKKKMYQIELEFLQDVTGISKKIWNDNYFNDNDKQENIVTLKVQIDNNGKKEDAHIKVVFNSYQDFLNFDHNEGNKNLDDLSKVGIKTYKSTAKILSFQDSRAWTESKKRKGQWSTSNSTKFVGTLKAYYSGSLSKNPNFDRKQFLMDYMLKGDKERGVRSNIQKLGSSKKMSAKSWLQGKDFNNSFFSGFVLANHMNTVLEREMDNPTSVFAKRMAALGEKMEITMQRGIKGFYLGEGGKKENIIDNEKMSDKDFWLSQFIYFNEGGKTYNAISGQFADKGSLIYINSPKTKYTGSEAQKKRLGELIKDFDGVIDFMITEYGSNIRQTLGIEDSETDQNALRSTIENFVYNFAINSYDISNMINGEFEGANYRGDFTDLIKRAAPVISPGYRLSEVDGGIGKTYTHLVLNDPKGLDADGLEFEIPDGLVIGSKSFMEKFAHNMGSIYNRKHQFKGGLSSSKALHSATSAKGVRGLTKGNIVSIEVFLEGYGEKFKHLADLMEDKYDEKGNLIRKGVDTISFDSTTKKNENPVTDSKWSAVVNKKGKKVNLGSLALFNKDLSFNDQITDADIAHFVFERNREDLYVQQDLRHDVEPRGNSLASQWRSNATVLEGADDFLSLMNQQIDTMMEDLFERFDQLKDSGDKKKFVLDLLSKGFIQTEDGEEELTDDYKINSLNDLTGENRYLADRLLSGMDSNSVWVRKEVTKKILSYIEKEGLLMYGNRQTTQAIPDMFNQLSDFVKVKDYAGNEQMQLPEIAANIPGARLPKFFSTMALALREIKANKDHYPDMLDKFGKVNEWDIKEKKDSKGKKTFMIPGDMIISSRVPGDDLHSHTMGRYTIQLSGNFTSLPQLVSRASGEDFDGDQRYNQVFFRNRDGKVILDSSKEGLSNKAMLAVRDSYQNPANNQKLTNPINTDKYNHFIEVLTEIASEEGKDKMPFDKNELANPITLQESRKNNMVGVGMKGIMTNLSTVFSYLNKINPAIAEGKEFNLDFYGYDGEVSRGVSMGGLAKDDFNVIKAHIGYLLNMAYDNAKDPRIEKMGLNETTANMFIFTLINDQALGSDKFKTREAHDKAITDRIEEISILFNQPEFKYYTEQVRGMNNSDTFMSAYEIAELALSNTNSRFGRNGKTSTLNNLFKASKDLGSIKNVQRYTEKTPKNFEQYHMGKNSIDKLKQGRLEFYDNAKFFNKDGELIALLENAEKSLNMANELVFENNIESSELMQFVMEEVRISLAKKDGSLGGIFLDEATIKTILSSTETLMALMANSSRREYGLVKQNAFKRFEELRNEFPENQFLQLLQVEEKVKATEMDYKIEDNKLSVLDGFRQYDHNIEELREIQNDFDKLPKEDKDLLFEYMLFTYQTRTMPTSGTYYRFISNDYLKGTDENTLKVMNSWNEGEYAYENPEAIGKLILSNIKNILGSSRGSKAFNFSLFEEQQKRLDAEQFSDFLHELSVHDFQDLATIKTRAELDARLAMSNVDSANFLIILRKALLGKKIKVDLKATQAYNGKTLIDALIDNIGLFVKEEEMNKDMFPGEHNFGDVYTSTKELIESGDRTATTRTYPLGFSQNMNKAFAERNGVGKIFKIKGIDGFFVVESVEKLTRARVNDKTWVKDWSKKEGWTVKFFNDALKNPKVNTVKIGSYQTTFRKLSNSELRVKTQPKNNLNPIFKGKMIFATTASGKSEIAQKYNDVIDTDVILMDILNELGADYKEKNSEVPNLGLKSFGQVAASKAYMSQVVPLLKERVQAYKNQGKTILGGNFYFTMPGTMDLVDFVVGNNNAKDIINRSKKRNETNPLKNVIQPYNADMLIQRESNFAKAGFKSVSVFTADGKQIINLGVDEYLSDVLGREEEKVADGPKSAYKQDAKIREKYFSKGDVTTVAKILNDIVKSKGPLAGLAKALLSKVDGKIEVQLFAVNEIPLRDKTMSASAAYAKGRIAIAEFGTFQGKGVEGTIIHEIIHALLGNALRNNSEASMYFDDLFKYAKKQLSADFYGMKNVDEFAAELLSNAEFIQKVMALPALNEKKFKNLWEEILDVVLSLFGIKPNSSLYEEAIAVLSNVAETVKGMPQESGFDLEPLAKAQVKNQMPTKEASEALLMDDPELAGYMLDHLAEVFPEVIVFSDRQKFQEFVRKNINRDLDFSISAIGHAIGNTVFIDANRAVQSTPIHEHTHIYWDSLPENHAIKEGLRELYPGRYSTQEETDEAIIMDIGKAGVDMARVSLKESQKPKFTQLLKKFWNAVKEMFSKSKATSYETLLEEMAKAVWNHIPNSTDKFNQQVVRNMVNDNKLVEEQQHDNEGRRVENHVEHDKYNNKGYISPTAIKKIINPNSFNKELVASLQLMKDEHYKSLKTISERNDMIQRKIFENDQAAINGNKVHDIAEEVFGFNPEMSKEEVMYAISEKYVPKSYDDKGSVLSHEKLQYDSIISIAEQLLDRKEQFLKDYPGAKFHSEIKMTNPENNLMGKLDLVIELPGNKLVIVDFKTMDIKNLNQETNKPYDEEYLRKSRGRFNAPMNFLMNNKKNEFFVQLLTYKHLAESQSFKDKDGVVQKNKVVGMMILPIFIEKEMDEITDQDGNTTTEHYIKQAHLGTEMKLDKKVAFEDKMIDAIIKTAKLSNGKEFSEIQADVDRVLEKTHDFNVRQEAAKAVFGLMKYFGKDLKDVSAEDIIKVKNSSVYRIMNTLVDSLGYDYEDFYNHGPRKAISFEQAFCSMFFSRNKEEATALMKDNISEGVIHKRGKVVYDKEGNITLDALETLENQDEAGKEKIRFFFDPKGKLLSSKQQLHDGQPEQYVVLQEIGFDDLRTRIVDGESVDPLLKPGDRVAEVYYKKGQNKGITEKTLRIGIVDFVDNSGKFSSIRVTYEDTGAQGTINSMTANAGLLKLREDKGYSRKKLIEIGLGNISRITGKKALSMPKDNKMFLPSYAYGETQVLGTHFDSDKLIKFTGEEDKDRSIQESIFAFRREMAKMPDIETFLKLISQTSQTDEEGNLLDENVIKKSYQKNTQILASFYNKINILEDNVVGDLVSIIGEGFEAVGQAEALNNEHRYGIKAFPRQADQLYQLISNSEKQMYNRKMMENYFGGMFTSPREVREHLVPVNNLISNIENSLTRAEMSKAEFSNTLRLYMNSLDKDATFIIDRLPSGAKFFKRPEKINATLQPEAHNFSKWLYEVYDSHGQLADETSIIRVPSFFALKREVAGILSGKQGFLDNLPYRIKASRVHKALSPAAWDNEQIDFKQANGIEVKTSLINIKRHFADQLHDKKALKSIYGTFTERVRSFVSRNPLLGSEMKAYNEIAKKQYQNKMAGKAPLYKLGNHNGPAVAIQSEHIFEILEESGKQMISNFHLGKVLPSVNMTLNKYKEGYKGNAGKGKTTDRTYEWLKSFTNETVFGVLPEGANAKVHKVIDYMNRMNSLRLMALSVNTQGKNLTVGMANDWIWEGNNFLTGAGRTALNAKKAIRIMKNTGMVNIVNDAMLEKLSNAMAGVYKASYIFMEWAETLIQVQIYVGMMTKDQFDAYDRMGIVIKGKEADALNDVQVSMIKERVSKIHGDYAAIYAAPFYYTAVGKLMFQFNKWKPNAARLLFNSYKMDKNNLIQVGGINALYNTIFRVYLGYNALSKEGRIERHDEFEKQQELQRKSYEENFGKMRSTFFETSADYARMQVLQKAESLGRDKKGNLLHKGEKISFKDLSAQERKAIFGTLKLALVTIITGMMRYGDDDSFFNSLLQDALDSILGELNEDVGLFINPLALIGQTDQMVIFGPSADYVSKLPDLILSFDLFVKALLNPELYPEAFADWDDPYRFKGEPKIIMDVIRMCPYGNVITQARVALDYKYDREYWDLMKKLKVYNIYHGIERNEGLRGISEENRQNMANSDYTRKLREAEHAQDWYDNLTKAQLKKVQAAVVEELPKVKEDKARAKTRARRAVDLEAPGPMKFTPKRKN